MAADLWFGLLCCRDDAHDGFKIRYGQVRVLFNVRGGDDAHDGFKI